MARLSNRWIYTTFHFWHRVSLFLRTYLKTPGYFYFSLLFVLEHFSVQIELFSPTTHQFILHLHIRELNALIIPRQKFNDISFISALNRFSIGLLSTYPNQPSPLYPCAFFYLYTSNICIAAILIFNCICPKNTTHLKSSKYFCICVFC